MGEYAQCHPAAVLPTGIVIYLILNHRWHFPHNLDSFEIIEKFSLNPLWVPWRYEYRSHFWGRLSTVDLVRGNPGQGCIGCRTKAGLAFPGWAVPERSIWETKQEVWDMTEMGGRTGWWKYVYMYRGDKSRIEEKVGRSQTTMWPQKMDGQ